MNDKPDPAEVAQAALEKLKQGGPRIPYRHPVEQTEQPEEIGFGEYDADQNR